MNEFIRPWRFLLIFLGFILILALINQLSFFASIKNSFINFLQPAFKILKSADYFSRFFSLISELDNIKQKQESLKEENLRLSSKIFRIGEIEKENQLLKESLKILESSPHRKVLADVQFLESSSTNQFIILNKGLKDKVENNSIVINSSGVLIGKVIETNKDFSKVSLITNPNFILTVAIPNPGNKGILKGKGDHFILEMIKVSRPLEKGTKIFTSLPNREVPAGFLVGQIETIISRDSDSLKRAKVKPLFKIQEIEKVFILITP